MLDATREFLFVRALPNVEAEDLAEAMNRTADQFEAILKSHRQEIDRIRLNREKSEAGKSTAIQALHEKNRELVSEAAGPALDSLRRKVGHSEQILTPWLRHRLPPGANRAEWEAREAEARAIARTMDESAREGHFIQKATEGDTQTMRAFELGPSGFPLVSDGAVSEAAELYAETVAPEAFKTLQEERSALQTVEINLARALSQLDPPRPRWPSRLR